MIVMLTAILSSFNEVHNEVFWANLKLLSRHSTIEVLVVDGDSQDGTLARLADWKPMVLPSSRRGERYNHGIEKAHGQLILLVHPRSLLSEEGINYLLALQVTRVWGGLRHSFDWDHPLLRFTSWWSNSVRGRLGGIFYLDHCLYFTADLKSAARFPKTALFEDTYFSRSLRHEVWPRLLPVKVVTSAVRFRKNGLIRQSALNQILKILFHLRVSEKWMSRIYERGLSLNQK